MAFKSDKVTNSIQDQDISIADASYEVNKTLEAVSVDQLVLDGIEYIFNNGELIHARAGDALQSYGVNYVLTDTCNRVHTLRYPQSVRYFARELLAYFTGSLRVEDGLQQASSFWNKLANEAGEINSNYGYYIFHQPIPTNHENTFTQYEWVVTLLDKNLKTRRAIININQVQHKTDTLDFPCTISLQFFIRGNMVCCEVASRSTDVITGLPYDMGFFSLITELVYADLLQRGHKNLKLGYTAMKTTFTQIYESRRNVAQGLIRENTSALCPVAEMPRITDAHLFLADVYNNTQNCETMEWIYRMSDL